MNKRPSGFYSDFEIFLNEVTKEMKNQDNLSVNWLQGINNKLGAGVLSKIMSVGLLVDIPFDTKGKNSLTTGYAMQKMLSGILQKFKKKSKFTEKEESERIEKARLLYHEFLITLKDAQKKQQINELFEDLVSGEEILY